MIKESEWLAIAKSVSSERQSYRVQQQAIFRLLQSLINKDDITFNKIISSGISVDSPLNLSIDSIPGAEKVVPLDYPLTQINGLLLAAFNDDIDIMNKLLANGADLTFPGPTGRDALSMSIWNNSWTAFDWLIEKFNDLNITIPWNLRTSDGKRTTRLMDAVIRRNIHAVSNLIHNVPLDAIDSSGRTALHHNLLQDPYTDKDIEIAKLLIEYGAPAHIEDHEGVSPASLAHLPEQIALIDKSTIQQISIEAFENAKRQRDHIAATKPNVKSNDPTDPQIPQIQKPIKFKKPPIM